MFIHWFDIAAVVLLLVLVLINAFRGFVKEFINLTAWVAAYFGSVALYPLVTPLFEMVFKNNVLISLASFVTLFISIFIGVRVVGFMVRRKLNLGKVPVALNHGAGAVIGGVKWMFLLAVILSPLNFFPETKAKLQKASPVARTVMELSRELPPVLNAKIKDGRQRFKDGLDLIGKTPDTLKKNGITKKSPPAQSEHLTEEDRQQMEDLLRSVN